LGQASVRLTVSRFGRKLDANDVADFNAANAVVEATHRHKEIFYDDQ
jgi:hypothetical protein